MYLKLLISIIICTGLISIINLYQIHYPNIMQWIAPIILGFIIDVVTVFMEMSLNLLKDIFHCFKLVLGLFIYFFFVYLLILLAKWIFKRLLKRKFLRLIRLITKRKSKTEINYSLKVIDNSKDEVSHNKQDECIVCMVNKIKVICYPCFHAHTCLSCTGKLGYIDGGVNCVYCKQKIDFVTHIILPN